MGWNASVNVTVADTATNFQTPGPDSAVEPYLERLVATAREILGGNMIGAYAGGSLALGAYQHGRSDLDVALVTAEPLSYDTKAAVVEALRHEAVPCPARGLELVVYWRAVAGSGTAEPGFEVELNTGPAMRHRATFGGTERPVQDGRFWYAIDRSILREHGRSLAGPPAHDVFGEVARSDLRKLLMDSLQWYLDETSRQESPSLDTAEAVLGACRALVRMRSGYWMAKVAAANRLVDEGMAPDLLRQAIAARTGGTPPDLAAARHFERLVLDELAAAPG